MHVYIIFCIHICTYEYTQVYVHVYIHTHMPNHCMSLDDKKLIYCEENCCFSKFSIDAMMPLCNPYGTPCLKAGIRRPISDESVSIASSMGLLVNLGLNKEWELRRGVAQRCTQAAGQKRLVVCKVTENFPMGKSWKRRLIHP